MATRSWLPLPPRLKQRGAELMHFQCWLWGCDIRRPEGNLLLEYGFSRQRPPAGAAGSSAYLASRAPDTVIVLWGFGAFYGDPAQGGVYLKRYEFSPVFVTRLTPQRLPWLPDQIRPSALPDEPGTGNRCIGSSLRCSNGSHTMKCGCVTPAVLTTGDSAPQSRQSPRSVFR